MKIKPIASVLIPTYKRADTLRYVLDGLGKQTCKDFEVLIVLKPSGDDTEQVIEKHKDLLSIEKVIQNRGYMIDALNLGLEHAKGEVIIFLDDDAVPSPNWIEKHMETYRKLKVGGVAGEVIPARMLNGRPTPLEENGSHIRPNFTPFLKNIARKIWSKPVKGLEDYFIYISKAGHVEKNTDLANCGIVKSLLGMGANMSVLSKAVNGFKFPTSWILGLTYEQYLGWYLWKKGYDLVFNPEVTVYHLVHGQTLSRQIMDNKRKILGFVEGHLLFYRLYHNERDLSIKHRITFVIFSLLLLLKKKSRDLSNLNGLLAILLTEAIGMKCIISNKAGGRYNLLHDLEAILKQMPK